MNQTNIIKSSIITTLLASLALLSGCGGADADDDSEEAGSAELAGTWGGPGQPAVPKSMTVEPGDEVEIQTNICVVPSGEPGKRIAAYKCMQDGYRECSLDGGAAISHRQGETCWAGQATCTIYIYTDCLFKASDS